MIILDLQSRVPIFEQIKTGITRLIYLGVLAGDEQLPTVRALAEQLAVNPNTVQKAYQQLEAAGLIYPVTGRGNFVKPGLTSQKARHDKIQADLRQIARQAHDAGLPESLAILTIREAYQDVARGTANVRPPADPGLSPTASLPTANLPSMSLLHVNQPATNLPVTSLPTADQPATSLPVTSLPTAEQPATSLPVSSLPTAEQPATSLSAANQPTAGLSATSLSAANLPVTNPTAASLPATNQIPDLRGKQHD